MKSLLGFGMFVFLFCVSFGLAASAYADGLPTNVVLPLVFEREDAGHLVREIVFTGVSKKVEHLSLDRKICFKKQEFGADGVLVAEKNFDNDGKLKSDFVVAADHSTLYREFKDVTGGKQIVIKSRELQTNGAFVEKNFDDAGLLLSDFTLRTDRSKVCNDYKIVNGKSLLVSSRELTDVDHIAVQTVVAKYFEYDATGKLTESKVEDAVKTVETTYRPDGKTIWMVKTIPAVVKDVKCSYEYFALDGRHLKRDYYVDHMIVDVFRKDGAKFTQRWDLDGKYARLAEVTIFIGNEKQVVTLKNDGVTVDKVEHMVSGEAGWISLKVEPGDKLEKPVDKSFLEELDRADDKTAPELAPPVVPPTAPEKEKTPATDPTPAQTPPVTPEKTEAPKTEAPKTEAPKTETPKTETPKTETPPPPALPSDGK